MINIIKINIPSYKVAKNTMLIGVDGQFGLFVGIVGTWLTQSGFLSVMLSKMMLRRRIILNIRNVYSCSNILKSNFSIIVN